MVEGGQERGDRMVELYGLAVDVETMDGAHGAPIAEKHGESPGGDGVEFRSRVRGCPWGSGFYAENCGLVGVP